MPVLGEDHRWSIVLGGTLLFVSLLLFLVNVIMTLLADVDPPAFPANAYAEALSGPEDSLNVLANLKLWGGLAIALVVLAYSQPLAAMISRGGLLRAGGTPSPTTLKTMWWLLGRVVG